MYSVALNKTFVNKSSVSFCIVYFRKEGFCKHCQHTCTCNWQFSPISGLLSKTLQVSKFVFGVIFMRQSSVFVRKSLFNCQIIESIFNAIYSRSFRVDRNRPLFKIYLNAIYYFLFKCYLM